MFNIFDFYSTEKKLIYSSFPKKYTQDINTVIKIIDFNVEDLFHPKKQENLKLNGEDLRILDRVYFNEPNPIKEISLTHIQKTILNCIYLKHSNGFIRQKRLKSLLNSSEEFIVPFTLGLLGEYVVEILETLSVHVEKNLDQYVKFIRENPLYWSKIQSRVISYWNVYYRQNESSKNEIYIGKQIIEKINNAMPLR